jgi:hypothetical protein
LQLRSITANPLRLRGRTLPAKVGGGSIASGLYRPQSGRSASLQPSQSNSGVLRKSSLGCTDKICSKGSQDQASAGKQCVTLVTTSRSGSLRASNEEASPIRAAAALGGSIRSTVCRPSSGTNGSVSASEPARHDFRDSKVDFSPKISSPGSSDTKRPRQKSRLYRRKTSSAPPYDRKGVMGSRRQSPAS